ncbi:MAG: plastocyanin [Phormidium sp.]
MSNRLIQAFFAVVLVISSFAMSVAPAAAADVTIKMGADNGMLAFEPATVEVSPGDTVHWVINKLPPHNVVFDEANSADAGVAKQLSNTKLAYSAGDGYDVTIPEDATPGTYNYFCTPHRGAGMMAKLIIK